MKKITSILLVLCSLISLGACSTTGDSKQIANVLSEVEPKRVFSYFEQICAIPRGSDNVQEISNFVAAFAKEQGLAYDQDEYGNVLIFKPAAKGFEEKAPVALQCHMDMVYIAADSAENKAYGAVTPVTDGQKIWADGSSLGGDDGIGMAMILSVLADKALKHPPLEAIFTVNEETDFKGAYTVNVSLLKSKRMINLDSERAGYICVSSAGGKALDLTLPLKTRKLSDRRAYKLTLNGLTGGHSGDDIQFGRANAVKQMGALLYAACSEFDYALSKWGGGNAENAIPTDSYAVCAVLPEQASAFESFVGRFGDNLKSEYSDTDPDMVLTIESTADVDAGLVGDELERIVTAVHDMPDGVIKMSEAFDGIPETSLNLGVIEFGEDKLIIDTLVRSSNRAALNEITGELTQIVKANGGECTIPVDFRTWEYVKDSSLRELTARAYQSVTGKNAVIEITHAALECGIFYERMGGADIVSIGPDVFNPHTIKETIRVDSVAEMYAVLLEVLESMCASLGEVPLTR